MSTAAATAFLSEPEISRARLHIAQTRAGLLGSIKLLTAAQWQYQPAPERWSIAQIVDHVIAVQERVLGILQQGLAEAPPPPPEQDREVVDGMVINQIPNRLGKFPSPIPCASRFDKAEAIQRYGENCSTFSELLTSVPGLRDHAFPAPPLKAISKGVYTQMDGYQWILAASAHAERHTKQILEVIAEGAFPA